MADYQLTIDGAQEPRKAPETTDSREGQGETLALFGFPETIGGQMALEQDRDE